MVEAIVEFEYTAVEADELSLKKGDILTDVTIQSGGWWEGRLAGKRGMFPDNFVKVLSKSDSNMKSSVLHSDVTLRQKSGRRCKVLFSYQPANEDELRLNVDDVIDVIAEVEDGWWKGRLGEMVGVFPSNFVTEIVVEEPIRPRPGSRDESRRVLDSESDNERSLSVSSPDSAQLLDAPAGSADVDADVPNLPPKPVKEQCRVLFAYEAANGDELTLKEGDIVTVLSRDVQDRGWWRGELGLRVGLFPDNFVELIKVAAVSEEPPLKPERAALSAGTNIIKDRINRPPVKAEAPAPVKKPADAPTPVKKPAVSLPGTKLDHVDGAGPSRMGRLTDPVKPPSNKASTDPSYNTFDHVARSAMLTHPTASRVKPPARRPPTGATAAKDEEAPTLTNGTSTENVHHEEPSKKSWEKNKAPWMEELKINQIKKKVGLDKPTVTRPKSMFSETSGVKTGSSPPTAAKSTRPLTAMTRTTSDVDRNGVMSKSVGHKTDVLGKTALTTKEIKEDKLDVGELVAMVRSLQASLEQHKEATARELGDLTQKLNEERQKRVQVELQLNKLTDLVTQV